MPNKNDTEQTLDRALWQQVKQGNKDALGSLARRHYASLLRYGMALGKDKDMAQDTIQDLFVALWDKRSDMALVENVKAYLFTALRRRLLRDKMKEEREKTWLENLFSKPETDHSFETEWINLEKDNENKQRVNTLISNLSDRQKEIVQLKFYEGMDNENIAAVMGITKQGVANLLVRTMKDLRLAWHYLLTFWLIIFF